MYKHIETDLAAVGLHDRRATHVEYADGILAFDFPDGFFILSGDEPYRSGPARMECHILDGDFYVSLFTEKPHGLALREDFTDRFADALNKDGLEYEFVTMYTGYERLLFKGCLWSKKRPYHKECEIEIRTDGVKYFWN